MAIKQLVRLVLNYFIFFTTYRVSGLRHVSVMKKSNMIPPPSVILLSATSMRRKGILKKFHDILKRLAAHWTTG